MEPCNSAEMWMKSREIQLILMKSGEVLQKAGENAGQDGG
jgi:hypothetical protein